MVGGAAKGCILDSEAAAGPHERAIAGDQRDAEVAHADRLEQRRDHTEDEEIVGGAWRGPPERVMADLVVAGPALLDACSMTRMGVALEARPFAEQRVARVRAEERIEDGMTAERADAGADPEHEAAAERAMGTLEQLALVGKGTAGGAPGGRILVAVRNQPRRSLAERADDECHERTARELVVGLPGGGSPHGARRVAGLGVRARSWRIRSSAAGRNEIESEFGATRHAKGDSMERTAVVTGGSSGIGLALALALAERGDRVLACGSRGEPPAALARHARIAWLRCDLATGAGRDALVDWVRHDAAPLDLLFNNAGIQRELAIGPDLDAREVEREIAVNLLAPILLSAALVPALAAVRGCIVNISSGLGLAPKARAPVYCATKAALSSFSLSLRHQLAGRGVRVVDVITPLVRTAMTAGRDEGAMDASEFAARLLRAIERGRDEVYLGRARLLPPLLRIAPGRARRALLDA